MSIRGGLSGFGSGFVAARSTFGRCWTMPSEASESGKEHGRPNEFRCLDCGHEVEEYRNHTIPLKDCIECGDGRLQHVGPVLDECDECGSGLLYHGNRLGAGTYCDGCFDAIQSALPAGGVR